MLYQIIIFPKLRVKPVVDLRITINGTKDNADPVHLEKLLVWIQMQNTTMILTIAFSNVLLTNTLMKPKKLANRATWDIFAMAWINKNVDLDHIVNLVKRFTVLKEHMDI